MLEEIAAVKQDTYDSIKNLDTWSKPEYVKVGVAYKLNKCHVRKEPIGRFFIQYLTIFRILCLRV